MSLTSYRAAPPRAMVLHHIGRLSHCGMHAKDFLRPKSPFLHSFTPSLLHSCTPALLHSCTPALLHSCTPAPPAGVPAGRRLEVANRSRSAPSLASGQSPLL